MVRASNIGPSDMNRLACKLEWFTFNGAGLLFFLPHFAVRDVGVPNMLRPELDMFETLLPT